jgi:hypothetical protein
MVTGAPPHESSEGALTPIPPTLECAPLVKVVTIGCGRSRRAEGVGQHGVTGGSGRYERVT